MRPAKLARPASILLLAICIGVAVVQRDELDVAALERWLAGVGPAAYPLFIGLYAAATVLFLPGSVLTLAGGALFGPIWGALCNLVGATLGATLAFLLARHLAADWVTDRSGSRLKQLVEGVEAEGWRFVAFVRLVPVFPFNLLNYALGLTRIPLVHYVVASAVCMVPGGAAYTYLGYAGREAIAGGEDMVRKGMFALGLLALVVFLPRLVRRLRGSDDTLTVAELRQRLAENSDLTVLDVRGAKDYAGGHIDGALSIPLPELSGRLEELAPWRERPLAVVCGMERRSITAVKLLQRAGFRQPILVRGGMKAWRQDGLPTDSENGSSTGFEPPSP